VFSEKPDNSRCIDGDEAEHEAENDFTVEEQEK